MSIYLIENLFIIIDFLFTSYLVVILNSILLIIDLVYRAKKEISNSADNFGINIKFNRIECLILIMFIILIFLIQIWFFSIHQYPGYKDSGFHISIVKRLISGYQITFSSRYELPYIEKDYIIFPALHILSASLISNSILNLDYIYIYMNLVISVIYIFTSLLLGKNLFLIIRKSKNSDNSYIFNHQQTKIYFMSVFTLSLMANYLILFYLSYFTYNNLALVFFNLIFWTLTTNRSIGLKILPFIIYISIFIHHFTFLIESFLIFTYFSFKLLNSHRKIILIIIFYETILCLLYVLINTLDGLGNLVNDIPFFWYFIVLLLIYPVLLILFKRLLNMIKKGIRQIWSMLSIDKFKKFINKKMNFTIFSLILIILVILTSSFLFILKPLLPDVIASVIINEWYIAVILHTPEFIIFSLSFTGFLFYILKSKRITSFIKILICFAMILIFFISISFLIDSFFLEYSRFLIFLYYIIIIFSSLFIITRKKRISYVFFIVIIILPISMISSVYNTTPIDNNNYELCLWIRDHTNIEDEIVCFPPGALQNTIRGIAERVSEEWINEIFFSTNNIMEQLQTANIYNLKYLIILKDYNITVNEIYLESEYFNLVYENELYLIFYILFE
ncbi:MAG: hypothetical protein ACTSPY_13705 [Candidatus Helarchaeota archaeon]